MIRSATVAIIIFTLCSCSANNYELKPCNQYSRIPKTNNEYLVVLSRAKSFKAQAGYELGYSDMLIKKILFDDFYLYYSNYAWVYGGCKGNPDNYIYRNQFNESSLQLMVHAFEMSKSNMQFYKDYASKIMKATPIEVIKMADEDITNLNNYRNKVK